MTVLFYSPIDQRSLDSESLMLEFRKKGNRVLFLCQSKAGVGYDQLIANGVEIHYRIVPGKTNMLHYLKHIWFFILFCRKFKPDVVYSHLESANFVAAVSQYFISAQVFICRHHIDAARFDGFDKSITYRLTYYLARKIIVVSKRAVEYMALEEGVDPAKIYHINLGYDFDMFFSPNNQQVNDMKMKFGSRPLLVFVGRLTSYKRPEIALTMMRKLLDRGLDLHLAFVGRGELEETLREQIIKLRLTQNVSLEGFSTQVLTYLAAARFLIHPSVSESSCVTVKEAGLVNLPVIICRHIGDFDEYMKDGINGYLVDADKFADAAAEVVIKNFEDSAKLDIIGSNLHEDVLKLFDIKSVFPQYYELISHKTAK